jgi:hypothetical protein
MKKKKSNNTVINNNTTTNTDIDHSTKIDFSPNVYHENDLFYSIICQRVQDGMKEKYQFDMIRDAKRLPYSRWMWYAFVLLGTITSFVAHCQVRIIFFDYIKCIIFECVRPLIDINVSLCCLTPVLFLHLVYTTFFGSNKIRIHWQGYLLGSFLVAVFGGK